MNLVGPSAAALAVLVLAWSRRPLPSRIRDLSTDRAATPPWRPRPVQVSAPVGAILRRWAGRAPSPTNDTRLGRSVLVGLAVALAVEPVLGVAAGSAVWLVAAARGLAHRRRDDSRLAIELPDVVDLLLLGVDSGLTVRLSIEAVASHADGMVATRFASGLDQMRMGRRLVDVLDEVQSELGERVRPLVGVLLDAELYGTPLRDPLERVGTELRLERRRRAEEAARRVPVKLLFPLVFCTLPAFALVTVVPLLAGSWPALPD
jgi:tight adherence protein C